MKQLNLNVKLVSRLLIVFSTLHTSYLVSGLKCYQCPGALGECAKGQTGVLKDCPAKYIDPVCWKVLHIKDHVIFHDCKSKQPGTKMECNQVNTPPFIGTECFCDMDGCDGDGMGNGKGIGNVTGSGSVSIRLDQTSLWLLLTSQLVITGTSIGNLFNSHL